MTATNGLDRRRFLSLAAGAASVARAQSVERPFRMGFTPAPASREPGNLQDAFQKVAAFGDIASLFLHDGIPWPIALVTDDLAAYPPLLRDYLLAYQAARRLLPNHQIVVSSNVIHHFHYDGIAPYWGDAPNLPLPPDWVGRPFNDDAVKRAALNHLSLLVRMFEPHYLTIGVEVNLLFSRRPLDWPAYTELHRFLYRNLKERFPEVNVNCSVLYENLVGYGIDAENLRRDLGLSGPELIIDAAAGLRDATDGFGVSTYPFMIYGLEPPDGYYDLAALLAWERGLPLWIEQTGHPSRPLPVGDIVIPGSEEAQEAFIAFILERAVRYDARYVVNWIPRDYGNSRGADLVSQTWAHTGLWREDNTPKLALRAWEAYRNLPLRAGR